LKLFWGRLLENLLEYYKKSDGATKKKICGCNSAEKLVLENVKKDREKRRRGDGERRRKVRNVKSVSSNH
jgi:hypothetical protein